MDPCELRLAKGDAAVRDLVADRQPLLDFALRSVILRFDLDTAEGRVGALRATAPLVAKIKDRTLRPEYARKLAGDLGMELETVQRSVASAAKGVLEPPPAPNQRRALAPDSAEALVEREALKLALQLPALAGPMFDAIGPEMYTHPTYAALRTAVTEAGGASSAAAAGGAVWIEQVRESCQDLTAAAMIAELAVEPLRLDGEPDPRYVEVTINRLQLMALNRTIGELKSKLQRINPVSSPDDHLRLFSELVSLEGHARALRDRGASRW
jgi:DNA primase